MTLRDLFELSALALVVAAVALAAGLWPALLAAGVALAYVSHAFEFGEPEDAEADRLRAAAEPLAQMAEVIQHGRPVNRPALDQAVAAWRQLEPVSADDAE